jgi:hypothetical protein
MMTLCLRTPLIAACILSITSCDARRALTDPVSEDDESAAPVSPAPSHALAYSGGMPFGHYVTPTPLMGFNLNATMRNARLWLPSLTQPTDIVIAQLKAIRDRGGKVILSLTGSHLRYLDENGCFSMTKWKNRVNSFARHNFSSFINDGTIIAHYIVDEPNDKANWCGKPILPATVEEMAKYSKQLWPNMPTVARAEASYLAQWSGTFRYLDAAWAQYVTRKGDPSDFINRNVADAKRKGLALITGLNILKGGPNRTPMTASTIRSAGSALLSSSYPCTFINWMYDAEYLSNTNVRDALKYLRSKALNRPYKSCR